MLIRHWSVTLLDQYDNIIDELVLVARVSEEIYTRMDGLWKNRSLNTLKNKYYLLERKSKIILKYHFQLLYDTLILFLNYDHIDRYTHT